MDDRIERELVIDASPAELWEVVTAPGWLAEDVELELFPGGAASFGSDEDARCGWVEEATAPDAERAGGRLVFWWGAPGEPASRVELTLEPEGETTRIHVVETRPLEVLDLVGIPLPGGGGSQHGPAMLSVA